MILNSWTGGKTIKWFSYLATAAT
uniref:Uncharacterized protein n=1 Tax=Rhizophora mucronata TaxID=61149 RepID=A0A2P2N2L6_RHIMU